MKEVFTKYTATELVYFSNERYNDEALRILFESMTLYNGALNDVLFMYKKDFLDFQATLTQNQDLSVNYQQESLN